MAGTKRTYYGGMTVYRKRRKVSPTAYLLRNSETKEYLGTTNFIIPLGGASVTTQLAVGIIQNLGPNGRVGNRIRIKSIKVHGSWGSGGGIIPITAALVNFKAQNAPLAGTDFVGPFLYKDNADTWQSVIQDTAGAQTFTFTKNFGGMGRELRYDKDTPTVVVGDFNPCVFMTNNNGVATGSTQVWWRIQYTDLG